MNFFEFVALALMRSIVFGLLQENLRMHYTTPSGNPNDFARTFHELFKLRLKIVGFYYNIYKLSNLSYFVLWVWKKPRVQLTLLMVLVKAT
jgi:hypothetical protein